MYVVRFSYAVSPVNRRKAIGYIQREIEAAGRSSLKSRLLVPITRAPGAPSLQFEVELKRLDKLEAFRSQGIGSKGATAKWMHPTATLCWAGISRYVLGTPELSLIRRPRR